MSDSLAVSTPAGTGGQVARWSTRPVPGAGLLGRWPELVPIAATAAAWACLALTGPATQPGAAHAGRAHAGPLAALPGAGGPRSPHGGLRQLLVAPPPRRDPVRRGLLSRLDRRRPRAARGRRRPERA